MGELKIDRAFARKALRISLYAGFAGLALVVFALSSYVSFSLLVRRGEISVPDLYNLELEEAKILAASSGLVVESREGRHRFDPDVRPGGVVEQSPRASMPVKRGGVIAVTLSLGRQLVEVPDLSGQTVQTAAVNLEAAGLDLGNVLRIYDDDREEGRVARQSPAPGGDVDHRSSVDLFLSLGAAAESFVMPDLVYRGYDQVREFFEERGFRVGSVKYEPYEGIEPGVVLRQFPLAGHRLQRHEVISLVVASVGEQDRP